MPRKIPPGLWSTPQAARVAGITPRQAKYWDATGIVHPSAGQGGALGTFRLYTFRDLLALRAVNVLLQHGISLAPMVGIQKVFAETDLRDKCLCIGIGDHSLFVEITPIVEHVCNKTGITPEACSA